MRDYILELARDLLRDRPTADIDEIAATAGVKASHIRAYFETREAIDYALAHYFLGAE